MLTAIHPKLPMRDRSRTVDYYVNQLGFEESGLEHFEEYVMLSRDEVELHFFLHKQLDPRTNYGQVYIRVDDIEELYDGWVRAGVRIHPNGPLETKPWGQKEFALLDPDNNQLTFGQSALRPLGEM